MTHDQLEGLVMAKINKFFNNKRAYSKRALINEKMGENKYGNQRKKKKKEDDAKDNSDDSNGDEEIVIKKKSNLVRAMSLKMIFLTNFSTFFYIFYAIKVFAALYIK